MNFFPHGHVDQSLLNLCTNFLAWEKEWVGEDHIFVNEQSFKFRY